MWAVGVSELNDVVEDDVDDDDDDDDLNITTLCRTLSLFLSFL